MEIVADVKLKFSNGSGYKRTGLYAVIRFKESGKLFRTKLEKFLVKYDRCYTLADQNPTNFNNSTLFVNEIDRLSKNQEEVKKMIKDYIIEYIVKETDINNTHNKLNNALGRFEQEFTITVDINE